MIKKTITYEDFDGSKKTETFYFNLTKAELMEFEISEPGGMRNRIEAMGQSQDPVEVLGLLRRIIQVAIGEKTPDGKFIKHSDFANAFLSSDAYSELFLDLMRSVDSASQFITGLLPAELINEVTKTLEMPVPVEPKKDILEKLSPEEIEELKKTLLSKED